VRDPSECRFVAAVAVDRFDLLSFAGERYCAICLTG
jgi:hypothetical protein